MPTTYTALLEKLVAQPFLEALHLAAQAAEDLGCAIYAVGGLPRDLLLGRRSDDLDLVVEGDAIGLARVLAATHGGEVTSHQRFGTAQWQRAPGPDGTGRSSARPIPVDFSTSRSETYLQPAALPQVQTDTIDIDLRRRDFTINAMAMRLDANHFGELIDPMGGQADLRRKLVKVLHSRSFEDDPTRMFRAVRYEQRLGFHMGRETIQLVPSGARWVYAVSGERLRNELDLILAEPKAAAMLRRLEGLDLLRRVHPSLPADPRCLRRLGLKPAVAGPDQSEALRWRGWLLWLLDLKPARLRSIGRRLAMEKRLVETLVAAAHLYQTAPTWARWRASKLTLRLDEVPEPAIDTVRAALPAGVGRRALDTYLSAWRDVKPRTTSRDLQAFGLQPGPRYGSILQRLRAAWIDGEVQDARAERELLETILKRSRSRAK